MPRVSVVIPTYNRPDLIKEAVESVMSQTYSDTEIIVVDDGMEQRAEEVLSSYIEKGTVKYIKHDASKGGSGARNTGIKAAKGEYVAFLDDDDEWESQKLEIQISAIDRASERAGFSFSAVTNVYDDYEEVTEVKDGEFDTSVLSLKKLNGFLTVTLVIRRTVLEEVGGFDETLPSHQDPELIIRISQKYTGVGVNKPLVRVNMKGGRERIGANLQRRIDGREKVLEKHYSLFAKHPKILARHYSQLGYYHRDIGKKNIARNYFIKAWLKDKTKISYFLHTLTQI